MACIQPNLLDWLNHNSGAVQAVSAFVYTLFTYSLMKSTQQQAGLLKYQLDVAANKEQPTFLFSTRYLTEEKWNENNKYLQHVEYEEDLPSYKTEFSTSSDLFNILLTIKNNSSSGIQIHDIQIVSKDENILLFCNNDYCTETFKSYICLTKFRDEPEESNFIDFKQDYLHVIQGHGSVDSEGQASSKKQWSLFLSKQKSFWSDFTLIVIAESLAFGSKSIVYNIPFKVMNGMHGNDTFTRLAITREEMTSAKQRETTKKLNLKKLPVEQNNNVSKDPEF